LTARRVMTRIVVMTRRQSYSLVYAPQVKQHLAAVAPKNRLLIREAIEQHLLPGPAAEPAGGKPLSAPLPEAVRELRVGSDNRFRVLYEVDDEAREVHILAVVAKTGNRPFVGGEEVLP
jgi:mRNA-degrading endonuclease RelE of RelBE toxin-antitoxin system